MTLFQPFVECFILTLLCTFPFNIKGFLVDFSPRFEHKLLLQQYHSVNCWKSAPLQSLSLINHPLSDAIYINSHTPCFHSKCDLNISDNDFSHSNIDGNTYLCFLINSIVNYKNLLHFLLCYLQVSK